MSSVHWIEANQRVLVAEFARIRARIAGEVTADVCRELAAARDALGKPAAIDVLSEAFDLTPFERDVLLLCAGLTMDTGLAEAYAPHAAATTRPHATFELALNLLEGAHWSALTPIRPLRGMRLVHVHDERALTTSRLSIEERVLHYLAGVNYLDPRLRPLLIEHTGTGCLARSHERVANAAVAGLESKDAWPVVQLLGDDAQGQREVARKVAAHYGLRLCVVRARDLPPHPDESDQLTTVWSREAVLLRSALFVQMEEGVEPRPVEGFVERISGLAFIGAHSAVALASDIRLRVQRPEASEQKELWNAALGESARLLNGSIDAVAAQFRLQTSDILRTACELRAVSGASGGLERALWEVCRDAARQRLDDLADRVEPAARWEDLVLPEPQIATLRQIATHVRHRMKVHVDWGFATKSARGLGLSVLFSGESGTGKTMAAEVLANELRLDLYRIDLSSMVSKYIGETEKNLRRVFDAAEASGAILLFDEADALFGKRSEVKDSHDRYANIEVAYLLQRMEAYRGLAILTSNLKGGLDTAFQRRLQFIVQFPFPDASMRERIWRGVFPTATPLHDIHHARLAQLNVAGGSIRNIALNAAFLAAEAGSPVGMKELLHAARREATKRDRQFSETEIRGWA